MKDTFPINEINQIGAEETLSPLIHLLQFGSSHHSRTLDFIEFFSHPSPKPGANIFEIILKYILT
ncbi:MAG: hypothetical protein AB1756_00960, partial [Acidobacteriota bacterium]